MLDPQGDIPQVDPSRIPQDEATEMFLLNNALSSMDKYVSQFGDALQLFEYCGRQMAFLKFGGRGPLFSWQLIAARDAIMSVYHFRHEMTAANNYAKQSKFLGPFVSSERLHEAHSSFDRSFPNYAATRNAVAHTGEMAKNKSAWEENSFNGSYEGGGIRIDNCEEVIMADNLFGRTFTSTTFKGKIVQLEMSMMTMNKLAEVKNVFFKAFGRRHRPAAS